MYTAQHLYITDDSDVSDDSDDSDSEDDEDPTPGANATLQVVVDYVVDL